MEENARLARFFDEQGRLTQVPAKYTLRVAALRRLAERFEPGRDYTEQEVNAVIAAGTLTEDYVGLRRGLVEQRFLGRERDGSRYWKIEEKADAD